MTPSNETITLTASKVRALLDAAIETSTTLWMKDTDPILQRKLNRTCAAVEAELNALPCKAELEPKLLDRAFIQSAGDAIKAKLPDNYGFILLAFPFNGEGDKRLVYCSNAQRADALNTVKEWLLKCGASEGWMKHIN